MTTVKSWTGYKAIFNAVTGYYTFEATATSGLTYTDVTPTIGMIYDAGALVSVSKLWDGIPTRGLVFYAPLSSEQSTAETGQYLYNYSRNYTTYKGVPCAQFSGEPMYSNTSAGLPTGNNPWTICIWVCPTAIADTWNTSLSCMLGSWEAQGTKGVGLSCAGSGDNLGTKIGAVDTWTERICPIVLDTWYFLTATYDGSTIVGYCGGASQSVSVTTNIGPDQLVIGNNLDSSNGSMPFYGYISSPRVYNRVLSQAEIAALAVEFTPTTI